MSMRSAVSAVDHLLLGVSDLDYGMQFVEEKSGIKPVIGGVHPGRGTRNALLSLGDKHYLEIIAPDPAQKEYQSTFDVRALKEPALITWAASAANIDALAKTAQDSGFKVAGPAEGSRKKGDGTTLRWKAFRAETAIAAEPVDVIPFFIEWAADSIHPSQDSPKGCELESLVLEHPEPDRVKEALKKFGIDAATAAGKKAGLTATIRTPRGQWILR